MEACQVGLLLCLRTVKRYKTYGALLCERYGINVWWNVLYCWWFRNPANQLRLVVYPIICRVLNIPGGAGFLPSTVVIHLPLFSFFSLNWEKNTKNPPVTLSPCFSCFFVGCREVNRCLMAGGGPVSRHVEAELGSHERIHRGDTVRCYTAKVDPSAISKVGFIESWQDDHEDSFWICRRTQERSFWPFWSCCSVITFNLCGLTSNKFTYLKHAPIDLNRSTVSKFQWALAVETPARTTCRWLFAWHDLKIGWHDIRRAAQILWIFFGAALVGRKFPKSMLYACDACLSWCHLLSLSTSS